MHACMDDGGMHACMDDGGLHACMDDGGMDDEWMMDGWMDG